MSATRAGGDGGRKRVLFLAHRVPYPPDKGDKIRSYREMRVLAEAADLTVGCFFDPRLEGGAVEELRRLCPDLVALPLAETSGKARALAAMAGRGPLSLAYYRSTAMARALGERGPFDAALAFSSTMGPYLEGVDARRRVMDLCDLDSEKWSQYAACSRWPMSFVYRVEARRLGAYERALASRVDATVLVSRAEADDLRRACPGSAIEVVPNGIDLDYYDPEAVDASGDGRTLVFCGAMDYRSNVDAVLWFHEAILPRVRREVPDARFRIVGSNPAPEVRRLGESEGVEVTGRVPDVRPHLLGAAVSVAPLRMGRGVPNKVLEALALALPLVATPRAVAGLALDAFEATEVAEEPEAFAAAAVRRLQAARNGSGRHPGNRRLLEERYSWERSMETLRGIVLPEAS